MFSEVEDLQRLMSASIEAPFPMSGPSLIDFQRSALDLAGAISQRADRKHANRSG